MLDETQRSHRTVACGAGFAGDRIDPAVDLAASGYVHAVVLECLAERTLVPGLRARAAHPDSGADPRLQARLTPLLPVARSNQCRIITNLGAANPLAAGRQIAQLASELGCQGSRVAALLGDDVRHLQQHINWTSPVEGTLLGAHAYLGARTMADAVQDGADVVVTGRVADSALFSAELLPIIDEDPHAIAGATAVGHLLECSGQATGGNFEMPDGDSLDAEAFANLGFPLARVYSDGSADITVLDDKPARVDVLSCTLQLLYEVHDPASYITPDAILDFTQVEFTQIARNTVRMQGVQNKGVPNQLKVSGFVDEPGVIADIEIGYAGTHALKRARIAADTLNLRLSDFAEHQLQIDLVGVNSTLGAASLAAPISLPEVRMHVSARCTDAAHAQYVEDEVYALTLSGPAGGGSVRSERRPCLTLVDGFIDANRVSTEIVWETAA